MTQQALPSSAVALRAPAHPRSAPPVARPAFAEVFDAHFAYARGTLRRLGVSEADAQDQAQEVFVVVNSVLGDYDPSRPMRPWLFGIAYRIACRWRALARHRRELAMDAPPDAADPRPAADEVLAAREARDLVMQSLDTIDADRRAVLVMNLLDERPMSEVAEALGIPLNTAYSRLRLAREDFEKIVKRRKPTVPRESSSRTVSCQLSASFRDGRRPVPGNTGTMPHLRASLGLLAFASLLALPGIAGATEPTTEPPEKAPEKAPEKPAVDESGTHLTSLELMVRPTLGGAGGGSLVHTAPGLAGNPSKVFDGSASPYGASFGAGVELGFRFHPLVAAGLRGDLAKVSATAPNDGTTDLSRSRQSAGLYTRAYPLALNESIRKHVDPWFATGLVYMHDAQSFHLPAPTSVGTTVDSTVKLEHHGVGIPLAIGFDYRVTRAISIGPSFEYTFLVPIAGCATQSAAGFPASEVCSNGSGAASKAVLADSTGAWTAGLDIRFTPF